MQRRIFQVSMKFYFALQFRLLFRQISDFGFNVIAICSVIVIAFLFLSNYIISITAYSAYVYAISCILLTASLNDLKRNDFLRSCFSSTKYFLVRTLENTVIALPFIVCLMYKNKYMIAIMLLLCTITLPLLNITPKKLNVTIPTPFSKQPFEFLIGFRKTFPFIAMAYVLTFIATLVNNFNLGMFSLIVILLISVTYYFDPDHEFYVWAYSLDAHQFIWNKAKYSIIHTVYLSSPIFLTLIIVFEKQIARIIVLQAAGCLYIFTALLSKYANFPKRLILPEAFLFLFSFYFPPLLLFTIPYFYVKSHRRLKLILK